MAQAAAPLRTSRGSLSLRHDGPGPAGGERTLEQYFDKVTARFTLLERRLESWNLEQKKLLERAFKGCPSAPDAAAAEGAAVEAADAPPHVNVPDDAQAKDGGRVSFGGDDRLSSNAPQGETAPIPVKHQVKQQWEQADGQSEPRRSEPRQSKRSRASIAIEESLDARRSRVQRHFTSDSDLSMLSQKTKRHRYMKPASRLAWIVEHPVFDYFFACAIVLNSAFIGAETEYKIRHFGNNPGAGQLDDWEFMFSMAERTFAALFSIELLIRLAVLRLRFFSARGRGWNLFDMVLVGMSIVEIILDATTGTKNATGAGGMSGKVIRMFRMARIIRIMRVLRFLAELRVMVTLIAHSMRSLFWLMILLILILYVFSIFFTQGVHDYVSGMEERPASGTAGDQLLEYFGSLLHSAFTLFISITGGISWKEVITPLANIGETFTALFIIYIFFCIFSVLNIVTGVFVDGAIQRSSQERDLRLEKEREQKEAYVSMLLDLLEEIDFQKKGAITREELEVAFMNERTRHYFSVLDIDIADSNYLFDMLDLECSGSVDMEEFVAGCLRLKGSAKSIDVHQLMFEIKLSMKKWDRIMTLFLERKLRQDPAPDANNPHTSL